MPPPTSPTAAGPARPVTDTLAIDFVNSVDCPGCRAGDALESRATATRWVRTKLRGVDPRVGSDDLEVLRRLRDDLRRVVEAAVDGTSPPASSLARINRSAAVPARRSVLRWARGRWTVEDRVASLPTSDWLSSLIARSAIDLIGAGSSPKIRRCEGPGCVHFLLARRAQQRWCSPTGCGNRARVQRHYRRLHPAGGDGPRPRTGPGALHKA